ncbi:glycine-rich domain-containing protein 1-like [Salvia divinorum]|uniref:Glycine-rich domain-containing protein 1-like n=1 Tax=Salvia divinorum TaxID=28513 RepID=A0ABD1GMF4_SALDI
MEKQQNLEWEAAQSIVISVDLVCAAKKHLKFLAAVDRNRWLNDGPALDRAIYRYNAYWLPLLAKHSESPLFEGPLVVPLDCEWIWHSHRLNPIRYKKDCQELYGRLLDNKNVISSVEGTLKNQTEDMWKTLFPGEPFELDLEVKQENIITGDGVVTEKFTKYDLVSAVQRQTPFFHQVSQLHMNDTRYIRGAVARYKGFLHLIKRNKEQGIQSFIVPTYDIDLIWHTHQLHPASYSEDLLKFVGRILGHDDTDSDRSKGQKLDVGFTGTNRTFEDLFGRRYWRAGAMYKGIAPSPVRLSPYSGTGMEKVPGCTQKPNLELPSRKVFEVMLEFVGVRNLPEGYDGSLFVSLSKSGTDKIFNGHRTFKIVAESSEKQVATFQCQPTGNLHCELMSSPSVSMGTTSVSLEDFLSPDSDLTVEKWFDLVSSNTTEFKPIGLRLAISVTTPTPAPYTLNMLHSQQPLPGMPQFHRNFTAIVDEDEKMLLNLHIRDLHKSRGKKECRRRVLIGNMVSGKSCTLAEFTGSKWSMVNSPWSVKIPNANNDDGHLFELTGPHTVRFFQGGRLDYDSKRGENSQHEPHQFTAIKFSPEEPYGTAVALLNMNSGTIKVKEEWFLLPSIIVTCILGNILRKTNQAPLQKVVNVNAKIGGCGGMIANYGVTGVSSGCGSCGIMMANCGVTGISSGCGSCGSMMANCGVSGGCGNMMANCGVTSTGGACGVSGSKSERVMANCGVSSTSGGCGVSGKMMANCGVSGASVSSRGDGSMMANCGVSAKSESVMANCGVSGGVGAKSESVMANCGISNGAKFESAMANCGVSGGAKSESAMANCGVGAVSGACGISSGGSGSMMANCGVSGGVKSRNMMANCGVSNGVKSERVMANCGVSAGCGVSNGKSGSMLANCGVSSGAGSEIGIGDCGDVSIVSGGCGVNLSENGSMMPNCGVSEGAKSEITMANCGVSAVSGGCGVNIGENGSTMANCGVSAISGCGVSDGESESMTANCGVSNVESGSVMANCGVGVASGVCNGESEIFMANCDVSAGESTKCGGCGVSVEAVRAGVEAN